MYYKVEMANNGVTPSKAPGFTPVTEANLPKKGFLGFGGPGDFTKLFHEIVKNQNNRQYLGRQHAKLHMALTINKSPLMATKGLTEEDKNKTQVLFHLAEMFYHKGICEQINTEEDCKTARNAAFLGSGLCEGKQNYVFVELKKLFDEHLPALSRAAGKFGKKRLAANARNILKQTEAVVALEATAGMPQPPTGAPVGTGISKSGGRRKTRRSKKSRKQKKTRKH